MALEKVISQAKNKAALPYPVEIPQVLRLFEPFETATFGLIPQDLSQFGIGESGEGDHAITPLYMAAGQIRPETIMGFSSPIKSDSVLKYLTQISPPNVKIPGNNAYINYDRKRRHLTSLLSVNKTHNQQIALIQLEYYESIDDGRTMQIGLALDGSVTDWLVKEGYFDDPKLLDLTVIHTPQGNQYFIESRSQHDIKIKLVEEDIAKVLKIDMPEILFDDAEQKIEVRQGGLHLLLHPGSLKTNFAQRIVDGKYVFDIETTLDEKNLLEAPQSKK